jgi:hypothetical protein
VTEDKCYWCGRQCGGTCLELRESTQMRTGDPAYWMLTDGKTSKPTVFSDFCYICKDPEFAQMGLPLCYACYKCGGHVPADDEICDECGITQNPYTSEDPEYVKKILGEGSVLDDLLRSQKKN